MARQPGKAIVADRGGERRGRSQQVRRGVVGLLEGVRRTGGGQVTQNFPRLRIADGAVFYSRRDDSIGFV
jgi:hypothetical protein